MPHTPAPLKHFSVGNIWGATPVTRGGKPRNGRDTPDVFAGSTFAENAEEDARRAIALWNAAEGLTDKEAVAALKAAPRKA